MKRKNFLKTITFAAGYMAVPKISLSYSIVQGLPNILLIGDSISIGYTPFVQESLKYEAKVFRPLLENGKAENCAGTTKGVENIDRWIGDTNWDIIHFNFGLHDIKHVDPTSGENSSNPKHPQQAGLKQYKKNLTDIVKKLKATGATLIFATTTPYPDKTNGPLRKPGMPARYNKVALKIMNKNDISVNNLHAFAEPRINEIQLPNNVHFSEAGSKALGEQVVKEIRRILDII